MAQQALGIAGAAVGGYFGGPQGAQMGFAAGSLLGGLLAGPKEIEGPRLGEVPVQTGRDGVPIPVGWGIIHTAGNIIQKNPVVEIEERESQGGKGGGTTVVNTRRLRTFAIGICRSIDGPVLGILRIWQNDKLVYDTRDTPAIPVADTTAYGSNITIYLGTDDQLPDPEFEAHWGVGTTPAFRGLCYIVWNNFDITDFGSAIPQYRFEVQVDGGSVTTSRIYPIEAIDTLQLGMSAPTGVLAPIPEDQVDIGQTFQSGTLRQILVTTDAGEDQVDIGQTFQSGGLRQILRTTDAGEDQVDIDQTFQSGQLRDALVRQTMVPEKLQLGISAPSGSMTAI